MQKLIKNELIKIFKRKNIYILILIGITIILGYNSYQKMINSDVDIQRQYERGYKIDTFYLENYEHLELDESYDNIRERKALEKYAVENKITYNILLNSQNKSAIIPLDARNLLMKFFNKFDIIICFIIIYLSCISVLEEFHDGTIKNLLTKPHKRFKILLSKILSNLLISLFIIVGMILFQYIIGGFLFGFDSYSLEAIRYNYYTESIETMSLAKYLIIIGLARWAFYLLIGAISMLIGLVTNNIAFDIIISFGVYMLSKLKNINIINNFNINNYLFTTDTLIIQSIFVSIISIITIVLLSFCIFNNKDIKNI